jgi:hypothetical protein
MMTAVHNIERHKLGDEVVDASKADAHFLRIVLAIMLWNTFWHILLQY